jgi:hypothetical protein
MFPPKIIGAGILLIHIIHEVPLHDVKFGLWYAINAKRIIGPIFYAETILTVCGTNIYRILRAAHRRGTIARVVSVGFGFYPHSRRFSDGFGRGVW